MTSSSRRPTLPLLIVEDKEENQMLLAGICAKLNFPYKIAGNGAEGLELLEKEEFSVYLVDLMMPVMDGKTFIQKLRERDSDPVILVQTAIDSSEQIIEIMKLGVYDYIIKPLNVEIFKSILEQALEYRYLKDIEKQLLAEESKELRDQLEWLNYKEASRKTSDNSTEMNSIFNLRTTLSQGSGFGAMTTLIETIKSFAPKDADGKNYIIEAEYFDLLLENNEHTKSMLRGLDKAVNILDKKIDLTLQKSSQLLSVLPELIHKWEDHLERKKIKINLPIFKSDIQLSMDLELIRQVLEEILLNAIKYSPNDANLDIFLTLVDGYFCLSIKNKVLDDSYSNFSKDVQKNLILPFYRVHPPVEEFHSEEPFSLGLGLTMVDYIANKHHGMFFIRNAKDHTTEETSLCIISELFLPIQNEQKEIQT
ncbi:hybrid sensor histidine kinase/response regulator [Leptospira idonii]|uniref:Response regulator n=1 Tax=Leptospira idonii TaxID=1193500 RepID=A0A4R9LXZ1_9LEPT|nr:response regulator [Leptospira idonii]TGN18451.1 response regulator [Leptospira idonii]